MGQQYYQSLPRTRRWQEIVGLLEAGAGAAQVANATIKAAEGGLERPGKDRGLVETIWLLTQLPQAARADDFAGALRNLGLEVSANPTLMEITGALTDALDQRLIEAGGRTDLGEMAQDRKSVV